MYEQVNNKGYGKIIRLWNQGKWYLKERNKQSR